MWIRPLTRTLLGAALVCGLCALAIHALGSWRGSAAQDADAAEGEAARTQPGSAGDDLFQGKVVCSLKRTVVMPVKGTIQRMAARGGQAVRKGDVLASYRIASDMLPGLKRRIAAVQVKDMEVGLSDLEKSLTLLNGKRRELSELVRKDLGPAQGLRQVEAEIQAVERQRAALLEKLRIEKDVVRDDLEALREQLGGSLQAIGSNEPVHLVAPISGLVIWVSPELREGAELPAGAGAFVVGVMDPMLMRAQVHELEAVKLSVGDSAEVSFESLPNRVFEGKVSRLAWAPLTPALEQATYYELELALPNPELALREGMKGQVALRKAGER
ncbi:MAG: efflux RND transporter periplasmic adaptor subunit [Syntrophobacteraceae bacterium]|jgi:multidrug resistance efflux pump|nr:efflux RND transporter periplasmic adaptor subunit [Syntrophobacteraceae bacterium]